MFKEVGGTVFYVRDLGGPGSGNFGHAGRPGERGGSGRGGEGISKGKIQTTDYNADVIVQDLNSGKFTYADTKIVDNYTNRGYSDLEANALIYYKGTNHSEINETLISGKDTSPNNITTEKINLIDSAINRSVIDTDVELYHGLGLSESKVFDTANVGSIFSNSAYYSTSFDKLVGETFSDRPSGSVLSKVMVIKLPSGSKGFFYQDTNFESEVLLPRNQKFIINNITKSDTHEYIHVSPVKS